MIDPRSLAVGPTLLTVAVFAAMIGAAATGTDRSRADAVGGSLALDSAAGMGARVSGRLPADAYMTLHSSISGSLSITSCSARHYSSVLCHSPGVVS